MIRRVVPTAPVDDLRDHAPAVLRRRLRHVCVMLSSVDGASGDRTALLSVAMRARGHLSGTLLKLDQLVAELNGTPQPIEDGLTERQVTFRIERST